MRHTYQSGIIGNCAFIAHVSSDTNISWMCWPYFDSSFIFGSLLDKEKGGEFSIKPVTEYQSRQYYIENTNVLCTEVTTAEGSYRITDFAPRFKVYDQYFKPLTLIRKIEPLSGLPRIKIVCEPTADYGKNKFSKHRKDLSLAFVDGDERLCLETNVPSEHFFRDDPLILEKTKYLVLTYDGSLSAPLIETAEQYLKSTLDYWRTWIKRTSIAPFHQEMVIRSALALKIHQYEDTGAIIAASTTSLPEYPGSGRNWDYRYCWLRDSYYVITALNHIGQFEEMELYANYINNITQTRESRIQPLYSIHGEAKLTERELPYLDGYMGNKPVRIGNQAYEHIQNDVHGQAMIALLPLYTDFRFIFRERTDTSVWVNFILDKIEETIHEKDAGIWEFRNLSGHHCYSNLFQWAGCEAAIKIGKSIDDQSVIDRAEKLKTIAIQYIESCYDEDQKVYSHAMESPSLDASTLQLIMMNYLDPASDRAKDHLAALEKVLKTPEGLFYRYRYQDDFGRPKSTFLICAFWYVEALACVGRLDEAIETFEELIKYSNSLHLFSEDVTADVGSQWGNFPQAYSHVGLMNAAFRIAMKLDQPSFLTGF